MGKTPKKKNEHKNEYLFICEERTPLVYDLFNLWGHS